MKIFLNFEKIWQFWTSNIFHKVLLKITTKFENIFRLGHILLTCNIF